MGELDFPGSLPVHTSLHCAHCGLSHDIDRLQNLCTACSKPLLAGYDLPRLRAEGFTAEVVRRRTERSLWRLREVLPLAEGQSPVTLGEGQTPLLACAR